MKNSLKWLAGLLLVFCLQLAAYTASMAVDKPLEQAMSDKVVLNGNVHPLARPEFDMGAADPSAPMERMILALRLAPDKQAELEGLLSEQQDPASPNFHRWLTPEEFGQRFGPTDEDINTITQWLTSQGFAVEEVAKGHTWINFSGTVANVEQAFQTKIHKYFINNKRHQANSSEPSIPRALINLVAGPVSLNDFPLKAMNTGIRPLPEVNLQPNYTSGSTHYMSPGDFSIIYNINALYTAGINGTGQSIAIVGRTHPSSTNWATFRSLMGLPANPPVVIVNGTDPGDLGGDEDIEADLDVEWSGAVAKNATVYFVTSATTFTTDGIFLSAQYIVNNNLAPVMSTSFGECESQLGAANAFVNNLWAQAASQGIMPFVSTGDSGAAGCDAGNASVGTGLGVNGLASTPYNVAVGGTEFKEGSGSYWNTVNSGYTSVISYIPEVAWNESGTVAGGSDLWSTSGGASSIYSKPSWQVAPGVPADGKRDIPDVSLTAAGHDGYLVESQGVLYVVGGTSASSPSFAGLMALIVQKTGQRQGNANTRLYQLGSAQYGAGGAAVFHDTTSGNNSVPGVTGYSSTTGYDLCTGLGSVDANALVTNWTPQLVPVVTTTAVTEITSTTATSGGTVTANGGAPVTHEGVCWATTANPAIGGTCTDNGTATPFVSSITGLTPGQTYHVRAYATNSALATGYGADVQFTALAIAPTVTTTAVTAITSTTATSGGTVTANGGAPVTHEGVCWATTANPAVGGTCTDNGTATPFVSSITGLTPGQTYHVRAYATNSALATGYGADVQFTALAIAPTVTTTAVTAITSTTATSGGTVTANGGAPVTHEGVCWATTANPAIGGTCTDNGTATPYVSSITGLTPGQTYHVRAYATNSALATGYGADVQFTALAIAPTVTTTAVTAITSTTATSGGTVTANGGAPVTHEGVCWATTANPAVGGTCTDNGTATPFVSSITGLTPGQTYHVRAYATNSALATGYGADVQFTALAIAPTVTTTAVTAITSTTATSGGTVTANGGAPVTHEGVCWAATANPAVGGTCTDNGTATPFVSTITGLAPGQTYHVRAYATNSALATGYGADVQFTALAIAPTVTTTAVTAITSTTATSGGTVTANGGAPVTHEGVCWAATANPAVGGTCTDNGTATPFVSTITGLAPGQTYHVRAYATNSALATGYGADVQFTALAIAPTVTTTAVTAITSTTATSGGTVTADGGATVTARGVCWATTANPALGGNCTNNGTGLGTFVSPLTNLTPNQLYHIRAYATNSVTTTYGADVQFTTNDHDKIGVFRNGTWYLDYSGAYLATGTWAGCGAPADPTKEACITYGTAGDVPIAGNWNSSVDGQSKIGVFRSGTWYLDYSGAYLATGTWAGCGAPADPTKEACITYGTAGDIPVAGNWNSSVDGQSKIGVFRSGTWYLDYSGAYLATGTWAGCGAPADPTKEACITYGTAGDIPVVGNWNSSVDGQSKIGVFRSGTWYLDYSGAYLATGTWAGCGAPADPTKEACITYGTAGDIPVVGDWNGDGKIKIGVFRNGTWYLDYSGAYLATGTWAGCGAPADPTKEACITYGTAGDISVVTK